MIQEIKHQGEIMALIISHKFREPGIHFFTPDEFSQQLGYMLHPAGKVIEPHIHNVVSRNVTRTQEVLVIKKGKLRVDFYDKEQKYLESRILREWDVILLYQGGHGFEVLEEVEMFEIKQGPFLAESDKTRFKAISNDSIVVKEK